MNWYGFFSVLRREMKRFWSIKRQTILGPLLETFLYISVFGAALGSRIDTLDGHSYINYIIPGLLLMAIAMNSYANNSASLLQQKMMHAIDDQLTSPVSNTSLLAAFTLGGFFRASIITCIAFVTASFLTDLPVVYPLLTIVSLAACGLFFASVGVLVGLLAKSFDNISFYQIFIIQPLIFLGGIFYSTSLLSGPFQTLTHINPIFYMINTVRHGMLGTSDVNPWISLPVIILAAMAVVTVNLILFKKGYRLRG
jgi:ABC-type polysaccharide/polyol phosphate export systems, permease component